MPDRALNYGWAGLEPAPTVFINTFIKLYMIDRAFVGDGVLAQHTELTRYKRPEISHLRHPAMVKNARSGIKLWMGRFRTCPYGIYKYVHKTVYDRQGIRRGRRPCAAHRGYEVQTSRKYGVHAQHTDLTRYKRPEIWHF